MPKKLWLIAGLLSLGLTYAQSSGVSGPISGFTFDAPTESIRAVVGVLGSASIGPALVPKLDSAFVAPGQNYAIAMRRGQVLFITGLGGQVSEAGLSGATGSPDGVVWSEDGSTAVLYSETGGWIQVDTGFPQAITPGTQIDVPGPGTLSAIAVSANGQRVAVGLTDEQGGVFEMAGGQSFALLATVANPIALSYSDDGFLYVLDESVNQVSEINLASSAIQSWSLSAADAVAIQPASDSSNNKVLYVAGRSSHTLLEYNRSTHQLDSIVPLAFNPVLIAPFGTHGFLLTRRSGSDPLWSFTNSVQPSIYFVPAPPADAPAREVGRK